MIRNCCALVLALWLAGCSKSVPELLEQAKAHDARGEKSAAVIEIKNALVQDPVNVEAHVLLGTVSADIGELLDAEKALHRALELGAEPGRVLPVLGRVLLDMDKHREMLDEVRPAAKMSAQAQSEIALFRARAHLRLGAVADARTQFFLAMRDRATEAKLGLAQAAATEGDMKTAVKLTEELAAAAPDNAEVWVFKGDLARADGKPEDALTAYRQALKLQPSNVPARLSQAVVHISSRDFDAARAEIAAAQKIAPALPMLHFTRALLALREQKYDECRDALQQVGRQLPQHMPSVLLSGSLFFSTGQLEQAQKAFYTYLARYPGNIYARKMLAASLLRMAQPQSASHVLAPLLVNASQDAELLSLAGQAYLQLGQIAKAREYLEQAVAIEPDNARTRANLGVARLVGGQRQKAVGDLEAAVALKPADMRAESYLIMALIAQNKADKALEAAQALEQKQPKEPITRLLKGAVYLAKQDMAQARASFESALKLQPAYFPAAAALAQLDLREKNPDAARGRMEGILKHDKNNLDALLTLANLEFDAGRPSAAIGWVRRAQNEHPQATQPYLLLAQAQLQSGDPNDALSAARQARDMNPSDPRALEILGRAQLAAGDKGAAIVSFSTLAGLMPQSVPVQLQLAEALTANGSHREAMAAAKRALQIDPGSIEAASMLGASYLQNKRYSDALALAQQAQKKNPRFGHALEGDVLMAQQDYARAAAAYRKADAIENSGILRVRAHEAETLASKGNASDALLVDWVTRHPEDINPRLYLADLYTKAGRYKAAIPHYEALLRVDPRDFRVINNLAWALQQEGDPRAIEYAHQAFQLKPDDATVADTLGWALVNQGKLYEGLQIMFKAVALDPGNPEIRFRLVQALVKAGDNTRARNELKAVLASGKRFDHAEEAQSLMRRLSP